jgi:hypothetical protein
MNYRLHSWHEGSDKEGLVTCYVIAALSVVLCIALVVYVIFM